MTERMFTCAAAAAILPLLGLAPAGAQEGGLAKTDLSGRWRIEVVAGASKGHHAVMDVSEGALGADGARYYEGRMHFNDVIAGSSARQSCVLKARALLVTVRCSVEKPGWRPDDFDLTIEAPDLMRGEHKSIRTGEAMFRREASEDLTS